MSNIFVKLKRVRPNLRVPKVRGLQILAVCLVAAASNAQNVYTSGTTVATQIPLGYGLNSSVAAAVYDTPFISNTTSWQLNHSLRFKYEFSSNAVQSFSSLTQGAELEARYFFSSGSLNVDTTQFQSFFSKSLTLNIIAEDQEGVEYLNNLQTSNLKPDAKAILAGPNAPQAWYLKYGNEIVAKRLVGSRVVAAVSFSTSDSSELSSIKASITGSVSYGAWSGGLDASVSSLISKELAQGNVSISIQALGGKGIQALDLTGVTGSTNFLDYVNVITNYMKTVTFANAGTFQYETQSANAYLNTSNPQSALVADAFTLYLSLLAKQAACQDIHDKRLTYYDWITVADHNTYVADIARCKTQAAAVKAYGQNLLQNPKFTGAMPADVAIKFPSIYVGYNYFTQATTSYKEAVLTVIGPDLSQVDMYLVQNGGTHLQLCNFGTADVSAPRPYNNVFYIGGSFVNGTEYDFILKDKNGNVLWKGNTFAY